MQKSPNLKSSTLDTETLANRNLIAHSQDGWRWFQEVSISNACHYIHCQNFRSALKSQVFEIVVGPLAGSSAVSAEFANPAESSEPESFFVHAEILSISKVLQKEVEGLFKERKEKRIEWPHWTVSGAEKFLDWLYTGDYKCPYPTQAPKHEKDPADKNGESFEAEAHNEESPASPPLEPPPAEPRADSEASQQGRSYIPPWLRNSARKQQPSTALPLPQLKDLTWSGIRPLGKLTEAEEFDKWTGHQLWSPSQLDYEATFMTHAELYVMACQYMLDGLKNMAWQRLRSVLITIGTPPPECAVIDNIMTLVRYVYQETGDLGETEEPLRELVTTFTALHFINFQGPELHELMMSTAEADREFVADLLAKVMQKVKHLETKAPDKVVERIYDNRCAKCRKKKGPASWDEPEEAVKAAPLESEPSMWG
ncbi:MAG: hypothetical protein Q9166_005524 [cf. Caloplaca sp. 2 TL-2023]